MQRYRKDDKLSGAEKQQVIIALEAILCSEKFQAAPQMSAFLRYVVEQTVNGLQSRIKAYTVAVEALGKAENFDSQNDPVVRVLAGRLRASLDDYYADNSSAFPRIHMRRGSYVPSFAGLHSAQLPVDQELIGDDNRITQASSSDAASNDGLMDLSTYDAQQSSVGTLQSSEKNFRWSMPRHRLKTAVTSITAAVVLFAIYKSAALLRPQTEDPDIELAIANATATSVRGRPEQLSVFISAVDAGNELQSNLNTVISGALSDSDNVRVYRIMNEKPSIVFWPEDYILTLDAMNLSDETRVSLQLMDAQTGRLSHSEEVSLGTLANTQLTDHDLSSVISAALKLINKSGPMFDDYKEKANILNINY
jgi:hypothetical protein